MVKAERGSLKHLSNQMKAKGLQRLRWFCQVCQKQCRDENGFKQHTLSEGHVRQMTLVGEDPKKYINNYSNEFKRDFLSLLKTSHGEKKVYINHFYQEYIKDKEHVHMNATKWPSLTEFAKYLGREGICRVTEGERGLEIQWIDDSPEAVKRREDVRRKDREARGDDDQESRLLARQIARARELQVNQPDVPTMPVAASSDDNEKPDLAPVKFSLGFGTKNSAKPTAPTATASEVIPEQQIDSFSSSEPAKPTVNPSDNNTPSEAPVKISLNALSSKPKSNPLSSKNPFSKSSSQAAAQPPKKMSNAERIMREEMDRKRQREERPYKENAKRSRYD